MNLEDLSDHHDPGMEQGLLHRQSRGVHGHTHKGLGCKQRPGRGQLRLYEVDPMNMADASRGIGLASHFQYHCSSLCAVLGLAWISWGQLNTRRDKGTEGSFGRQVHLPTGLEVRVSC